MRDSISTPTPSPTPAPAVPSLATVQSLWRQSQRVLASDSQAPCPSPCISVCRMSPQRGLCEGCWRDIEELRAWGKATTEFKREVWQRIQTRLRQAHSEDLT